jgi:hypothetical protein
MLLNELARAPLRALAVLAALATAASPAQAGKVFGPYLIWMNFAGDPSADHALHDYTHTDTTADMCWTEEARLLTGSYPREITPDLVRRAVIKGEPGAQARLRTLLLKGDDLRRDGYDGVIVVPKGPKPMLMSFGADGKVRSHKAVDKAGEPAWAEAFCDVQPPILRKP